MRLLFRPKTESKLCDLTSLILESQMLRNHKHTGSQPQKVHGGGGMLGSKSAGSCFSAQQKLYNILNSPYDFPAHIVKDRIGLDSTLPLTWRLCTTGITCQIMWFLPNANLIWVLKVNNMTNLLLG